MMDSEDAWIYYHDEARVKTNLDTVKKTAESVCSLLGFTLGQIMVTQTCPPYSCSDWTVNNLLCFQNKLKRPVFERAIVTECT